MSILNLPTTQDTFIKEALQECYKISWNSPDTSNKNGAVLVDTDNRIYCQGWNDFPYPQSPAILNNRNQKLLYIEHAERNVIFTAVKDALLVTGQGMVCPWFACADCARAIMLCGITRVYGHKQRMALTPNRWQISIRAALDMLENFGVEMCCYDGEVEAEALVNGQKINL